METEEGRTIDVGREGGGGEKRDGDGKREREGG